MKTVVLLSGGKDSVYNACICSALGHQLVCLASLSPPEDQDELDSYMYQTVGLDSIHFIAQAFDLPLYRRVIKGKAVDQSLLYGQHNSPHELLDDETEDLYHLLSQIQTERPDIEAVASGAILSTYQRTRVEHVCTRLGLASLAYLWQQDQFALLHEMRDIGMSSLVIKVAGAGLNTKHVGQDVLSPFMQQELIRLHDRFELHPCGEGGEFETFTVDAPLFKKRIEILETEIVNISPEGADIYSTVAYLRIKRAVLVEKLPSTTWQETIRGALDKPLDLVPNTTWAIENLDMAADSADEELGIRWAQTEHGFHIAGVCSIEIHATVEAETKAVFARLQDTLAQNGATLTNIDHINLYLNSMDDFAAVNSVYKAVFALAPPTRACVAVRLPGTSRLWLEGFGSTEGERSSLHVQSISRWAPANIGPYSQAVKRGSKIYVAGQIGLVPHSMQFQTSPTFASEALLALQHAESILTTFQLDLSHAVDPVICWIARRAWSQNAVFDALAIWQARGGVVPIFFNMAASLPRDAAIEWQLTASTGIRHALVMPRTYYVNRLIQQGLAHRNTRYIACPSGVGSDWNDPNDWGSQSTSSNIEYSQFGPVD